MTQNNGFQQNSTRQDQQHYQQPQQVMYPQNTITVKVPPKTKNKFLTFVLACVPGCGQMYHGLMKKGISIMVLFWGILAFIAMFYFPALGFALPIIWFYSFFDTVNRMNMPIEELKLLKDTVFFDNVAEKISKKTNITKWIGWGLVAIGGYALVVGFIGDIINVFSEFISKELYWALQRLIRMLPSFVIPLICIMFGLRLIMPKKHKEVDGKKDD